MKETSIVRTVQILDGSVSMYTFIMWLRNQYAIKMGCLPSDPSLAEIVGWAKKMVKKGLTTDVDTLY